ncbi:ATP-binding protein [Sphingomonas crocodyli]|uniref:histidine kinase n=1 Tax=Sphingomonas crocodyli TaxID=1979270 RepID=A0A437MBE1_9SPHN|nr:ATP-binding protein [Sphingomonas crocodyli]RVT94964.1 PAS domain-containing protein [Sphingomonas crocodyli]
MISVLIAERDAADAAALRRQLESSGCGAIVVTDAADAAGLIEAEGGSLSGLIVNVELGDGVNGWDLARRLREVNPAAAVGYVSALGHGDWAINGVPGSVLIGAPGGGKTLPDEFFRLCRARHQGRGTLQIALSDEHGLNAAIRTEREALQEHLQRTPSFIAVLDGPEHRFIFANEAYVRLVEREVVGHTVIEVFPEVQEQGFIDILDRVYRTGEDFVAHGVEFYMKREGVENKTTYIDLIYRPIRNTAGDIHGIFVEGEDLTEQMETRDRLETLQNELIHVARINAMGQLASALAHELTQPLAAIQNYVSAAEMLTEREGRDERVAECLKGAAASVHRAGEIIHRLRAMTMRGAAQHERTAIEPLLRDAATIACTGRPDVRLSWDLQARGMVRVDPVQIQQVMLNLIRNAIEAAGGEKPAITISTEGDGRMLRCCVSDAGPGIGPDMMPRIFQAFASSKRDGMGIGLSLSKRIIETHGGRMTAENNDDRGARFCFTVQRVE